METDLIYSYDPATTAPGEISLDKLESEIKLSSISIAVTSISEESGEVSILFQSALSTQEKTDLDALVLAHTGDSLAPYRILIENAIVFFSEIMITFAAENITLGITFVGKTKVVSDYLTNVLRYGQTGSLYEVISEIDVLIAATVPADLAPFVTEARLVEFKNKITEYLT